MTGGIKVEEHVLDISDESLKGTPFDQINLIESDDDEPNVTPQGEEQDEETDDQIVDQQDEQYEEEGEQGSNEETDDDQGELTAATRLAQYFKHAGYLPEDVEVPNDLDADGFEDLMRQRYVPKKEELDVLLYERALELGLDESTLKIAHMINTGVDLRTLNQANSFVSHINTDMDDEKSRENVIRAMYKDKGLSDKEVDKLVFDAQADSEDEGLAKTAVDYFTKKRDSYLQNAEAESKRLEQQQAQVAEQINNQLKELITSGKINGEEIPNERLRDFNRAVFNRTETIEQGGQRYTISPAYKKWMEFQQDPEKMLHLFYKIYYDEYNTGDESRVEQKVKEDFFDKLAADVVEKKGGKKVTTKKPTQKKPTPLTSLLQGLQGEHIKI